MRPKKVSTFFGIRFSIPDLVSVIMFRPSIEYKGYFRSDLLDYYHVLS